MITSLSTNLIRFSKDLEKADKARVQAATMATRVEAFNLSKDLKQNLQSGRAGHTRFAPLSLLARNAKNTQTRRKTARKPLARLAAPVRYRVVQKGDKATFQVGFVDPLRGKKLSRMLVYLGFFHQQGGTKSLGDQRTEMVRKFIKIGARLRKSGNDASRFFFLKKSTRSFTTPARQIIEPFWQANSSQASRNITANFDKKMRGERI